jgi:hypothetical protein
MQEQVNACAFVAQSRQRKKKRGRLLYSTPKALNRSRMRRSNVVQHFTPEHITISRVLDFQRFDTNDNSCGSPCIMPNVEEEVKKMASDEADIDEEADDQVNPNFQIAL